MCTGFANLEYAYVHYILGVFTRVYHPLCTGLGARSLRSCTVVRPGCKLRLSGISFSFSSLIFTRRRNPKLVFAPSNSPAYLKTEFFFFYRIPFCVDTTRRQNLLEQRRVSLCVSHAVRYENRENVSDSNTAYRHLELLQFIPYVKKKKQIKNFRLVRDFHHAVRFTLNHTRLETNRFVDQACLK